MPVLPSPLERDAADHALNRSAYGAMSASETGTTPPAARTAPDENEPSAARESSSAAEPSRPLRRTSSGDSPASTRETILSDTLALSRLAASACLYARRDMSYPISSTCCSASRMRWMITMRPPT